MTIQRPRDVMKALGVGKHGLFLLVKNQGFPKPIKLGNRSSGYIKEEIDAWVMARADARV